MREARYWLCLAQRADLVPTEAVEPLVKEATELRAILGKSVATARGAAKGGPAG
jgi:hypothetical protein